MGWLKDLLGGAKAGAAEVRGDPLRAAEVEAVLASLRPYLRSDGGDVELLAVDDGWVTVRLRGACTTCHAVDTTVQGALEPRLRERLPWFRGLRLS